MTQIKIKLEFERGGILYGFLNPEKAPKTVEEVVKVLPISIEAVQSRWCGREISWGIKTNSPWDQNEKTPESKSFESLAFYYGAEKPSYHDGALSLSVIGRISYEQEELMEEIGERIWLQGSERVRCSLA